VPDAFLEGWRSKADKPGADCPVGVSPEGFTDAAEREALLHGDEIRLTTPRDAGSLPDCCRVRSVPIVFSDGIDERVVIDRPASSKPGQQIRNSAKVYRGEALDGIIPVEDIVRAYRAGARLSVVGDRENRGEEGGAHKSTISARKAGRRVSLRVVRTYRCVAFFGIARDAVRAVALPVTILAYERQLVGILSWIGTASINVANEARAFRVTFTPQGGGDITVAMAPPTLPQGLKRESLEFGGRVPDQGGLVYVQRSPGLHPVHVTLRPNRAGVYGVGCGP
jgi:hypothetical protein